VDKKTHRRSASYHFSHPPIISVVPLEADRSPDTLAFAISSPGMWATRREKKKNLMSAPKIPKK
jgi:hypothetical protein